MVGGELIVTVRDQRDLVGTGFANQFEEAGVALAGAGKRIALDIELDSPTCLDRQLANVIGTDMALVGTRVHGDATAAGIHAHARRGGQVGLVVAARISQDGDLVEIDAQDGHAGHHSHG